MDLFITLLFKIWNCVSHYVGFCTACVHAIRSNEGQVHPKPTSVFAFLLFILYIGVLLTVSAKWKIWTKLSRKQKQKQKKRN